jgi:hypothetical protein
MAETGKTAAGDTFTDKVKPKHVRASNIAAAKCTSMILSVTPL